MPQTKLHIGTAGWSYKDWQGIVYPQPRPRDFDELTYLSDHFNTIEVNSTFYRPPSPKMSEGWLRKTAHRDDFSFTAKLWQRFTHERDAAYTPDDVSVYREGIAPLADARKLGGLLVQFPWSFRNSQDAREHLARIADHFADFRLFLELRHASWITDPCIDLFRKLRYNFVNIDQPQSPTGIPPTDIATGSAAYFRFHGRNAAAWFDRKAGRDERYNYLYSDAELNPWVDRIRKVIGEVEVVHVVTNNHYRGQAVANALQLMKKLTGKSLAVPPTMLEAFPFLRDE